MKDALPKSTYLKDYLPSNFLIDKTELTVELGEEVTKVVSRLSLRRNPKGDSTDTKLVLDGGSGLDLQQVILDGNRLSDSGYIRDAETLIIPTMPEACTLETVVLIKPQENTSLEGLYKSRTMFCTQCEPEGFRHITFYIDRPDVMSEFTTRVIADKNTYPVLLSNGNPVERGELDDGRHFVVWNDPFKKPSYLFALVAGTLSCVEDSFKTLSGREIALQIFVEEKDLNKCDHAMRSLKNAMRWDEEKYGREYDLDIFMIVAVDDFNMGAMENKGLNIFNTSAVLANPETTTDAAFQRIEGIVAHEYFHNWTGNRVTCRDWFQLSLKEGFTVFRDAQFSADMNSATVKRVEDVSLLRSHQFAEDAGPMAHPVQPDSYMEINNFYTLTIYEKGAEVVGMIHTLLGEEQFRKGSDLYFERYDGQAVTIEDFVTAMEDASGRDLQRFRLWYKQSGTPQLKVAAEYCSDSQSMALDFQQRCPVTPGQSVKDAFVIPVKLGLVGQKGDLPLNTQGDTEIVLEVSSSSQKLVIKNLTEKPIPSLLRGFSAPVKLEYPYSPAELAHLMAHDSDGFNRWDASQKLGLSVLQTLTEDSLNDRQLLLDQQLIDAYRCLISDHRLDPAMVALMLQLPSEALLYEEAEIVHAQAIHQARQFAGKALSNALQGEFLALYQQHHTDTEYNPEAEQIGRRSLKNAALGYLMNVECEEGKNPGIELAWKQFQEAGNMTDQSAALVALVNCEQATDYAEQALSQFESQWQNEPLAMNLWFQIQALNKLPGGLRRVRALMEHPAFIMTNPNKVRSLIGAFCNSNLNNFHTEDGLGYQFLLEQILALNSINPQIAARLVTPLTRWRRFPEPNRDAMIGALRRLMTEPGLAKDIYEIVSKSLAN